MELVSKEHILSVLKFRRQHVPVEIVKLLEHDVRDFFIGNKSKLDERYFSEKPVQIRYSSQAQLLAMLEYLNAFAFNDISQLVIYYDYYTTSFVSEVSSKLPWIIFIPLNVVEVK